MDNKIKLQVGERQFITTKETLTGESTYFQALLSGRWPGPGEDGYFIDSDPNLFAEILRYLRSGNFPLYFNHAFGTWDHGRYMLLLGEAQYFGISKLEKWIQNETYLKAITHEEELYMVSDVKPDGTGVGVPHGMIPADKRVSFAYLPKTKKVYLCPRGIAVHRGSPEKCGRQCQNARGEAGPEYEEDHVITVIRLETKRIFHPEVCLGAHAEPEENAQATAESSSVE
ncbi:hypothetical protein F5Y01DRAFT_303653 [Xylaria sp. FL0043]|nr:hypothetical protein F5Y01DRAFT_303653 [Xylaria sp. FL0043]